MIETQQTLESDRHKIQRELHKSKCLFGYNPKHPVCRRQDSIKCQICKMATMQRQEDRISIIRGIRIHIKNKKGEEKCI